MGKKERTRFTFARTTYSAQSGPGNLGCIIRSVPNNTLRPLRTGHVLDEAISEEIKGRVRHLQLGIYTTLFFKGERGSWRYLVSNAISFGLLSWLNTINRVHHFRKILSM